MVNLLSIASSTKRALRKNHTEAAPHRVIRGFINKASRESSVLFNTVLEKLFYLVNALSSGLCTLLDVQSFRSCSSEEGGHGELKKNGFLVAPLLLLTMHLVKVAI